MVMTKIMVNFIPTKMWYVLAIRVLAMFNRMYPILSNPSRDTKTSSKGLSKPISRGPSRSLSSPAPWDVSILYLGAPWLDATTSKPWYLRWEKTLSTSCGPPSAASRRVVNNMTQVIVGRLYVHVASHPHTTILFVQQRGSKWRTSSQPTKWWSVTRTRQINT